MKRPLSHRRARALAALAAIAAAPAFAVAEQVVAVTSDGRVITFDSATPGTLTGNQALSGVVGTVVAIDVRPADGVLYAVTSASRLYRVDTASGAATQVGSSPFAAALGTLTGIDFAPGTDRIRLVNDFNRSLTVDPNDGSLVDGDPVAFGTQEDAQLAYTAGDANFGTDPTIVAIASDIGAAVYGIDSNLGTLVRVGAPNLGTLQTIGSLGVTINATAGFDVSRIASNAFAVFNLQGQSTSGLYNVNLTTGGVTFAGAVGYPATVLAATVGPAASVLPIQNRNLLGLTPSGELVRFRSDAPGTVTNRISVTGLVSGDTLLAVDTRPSNGRLYGLGSGGRIYVINAATGLATPIRAAAFEVPLSGTKFAFEFNPAGSRVRIVSDQGQSLRVDPDTGAVIDGDASTAGFQGDASLSFGQGDVNQGRTPHVLGLAYDSNETTAVQPTLYVIDSNLGVLARQGSFGGAPEAPSAGLLHTTGNLGVNASDVDGFEIVGDRTAFAVFAAANGSARLHSIDLTTGLASFIDDVGVGETLRDLAAAPTSNPTAPGDDLRIKNLVIHMDYRHADRDSVTIIGVLPLPVGALLGQIVMVDVGGFSKAFTLGRVGNAKNDESTRSTRDDDNFKFAGRAHDGHLAFVTHLRREDLSDELTDEGMGGTATVRKARLTVQVTITVGGDTYSVAVPVRFTSKAGKTGVATMARN